MPMKLWRMIEMVDTAYEIAVCGGAFQRFSASRRENFASRIAKERRRIA